MDIWDRIKEYCLECLRRKEGLEPYSLGTELMAEAECPMHSPVHHFLVPAVLLTAYAGEQEKTESWLSEALLTAEERAKEVPGGACGYQGCCGAAVGIGIFGSIALSATPHSEEEWGVLQLAVGNGLIRMGEIGGPRCCKRNTFLALEQGVIFAKERLGSFLVWPEKAVCRNSHRNAECLRARCPFDPAHTEPYFQHRLEVRVPDRVIPIQNPAVTCECQIIGIDLAAKDSFLFWEKDEGEMVKKGELLCQAGMDLQVFELFSPGDGILKQVMPDGAMFHAGDLLGYLLDPPGK